MGLLRRTVNEPQPETRSAATFSAGVTPPPRSDEVLSTRKSLTVPAVFKSVQLIDTYINELSLNVFRNGVLVDPVPSLALRPDPNRELSEFLSRTVICLALHGNAYWRVTRSPIEGRTEVVALEVLNPAGVSIERDQRNRKSYRYATVDGKGLKFSADQVIHVRYFDLFGEEYGISPIGMAQDEVRNALGAANYTRRFFINRNGVPQTILTTDQNLDPDAAAAYLEGWEDMLEEGSTAVLSNGLKAEVITASPEALQLLDSRRYGVVEIATVFGVPALWLNASIPDSSYNYANVGQIERVFYSGTLKRYLKLIENALTEALPNRNVAKFDVSGFLREDELQRLSVEKAALEVELLRKQLTTPEPAPALEAEPA